MARLVVVKRGFTCFSLKSIIYQQKAICDRLKGCAGRLKGCALRYVVEIFFRHYLFWARCVNSRNCYGKVHESLWKDETFLFRLDTDVARIFHGFSNRHGLFSDRSYRHNAIAHASPSCCYVSYSLGKTSQNSRLSWLYGLPKNLGSKWVVSTLQHLHSRCTGAGTTWFCVIKKVRQSDVLRLNFFLGEFGRRGTWATFKVREEENFFAYFWPIELVK